MIRIGNGVRTAERILGIDTSAYTTSLAVVNRGQVEWEAREVLAVPSGQRGLRPSDAVFQHIKHLPNLYARCVSETKNVTFQAVAVSARPRPVRDSYLPPFVAGVSVAEVITQSLSIPLVRTTHQEGHIRAGLYGDDPAFGDHFHVLHVSGGTTELLRVMGVGPGHFDIERVGGSDDLFAGQFIDRIGVALGLPFPAGKALQDLAGGSHNPVVLPRVAPRRKPDGVWTSFSGLTTAAERAILDHDAKDVARGVELALSRTLIALVLEGMTPGPLLIVGGVAASRQLREDCVTALHRDQGWRIRFGTPEFSRDNAVGVALIGWDRLTAGEGDNDGTNS